MKINKLVGVILFWSILLIITNLFSLESQDVVYLKNGAVIRGEIIEQVPGESLKIQTRDGSIFVYKMEEVSKISKESSKE